MTCITCEHKLLISQKLNKRLNYFIFCPAFGPGGFIITDALY